MADAKLCMLHPSQLGYDGPYTPTIKQTLGSSANGDAERLHKAMKGLGTNESELIAILGNRTWEERKEIIAAFQQLFGKSLFEYIHDDTSGDFRKTLIMLLREPAYVKAHGLYHSMQGLGTKEREINEILLSSTNEELVEIEKQYKLVLADEGKDAQRSLSCDISDDTSGTYLEALKIILNKQRDQPTQEELKIGLKSGGRAIVSAEQARVDAAAIKKACKGLGTDEDTLMKIILQRHSMQLKYLVEVYPEVTGDNLYEDMTSELSGDFRNLILDAIEMACERPQYYARCIRHTMKGLGTNDTMLRRYMITRCEIDLEDIKRVYPEVCDGDDLCSDIRGDTSGDYQKLLLALAGE